SLVPRPRRVADDGGPGEEEAVVAMRLDRDAEIARRQAAVGCRDAAPDIVAEELRHGLIGGSGGTGRHESTGNERPRNDLARHEPLLRARGRNAALQVLRQAQRVVDRGVDVARLDRVADAVEDIAALGVAYETLRLVGDEGVVIDLAAIARGRLQRE